MIPTTDPALSIARLFNRRPTTPWSDKELRTYKKLYRGGCFDTMADLNLLHRYYAFERRKGDKGIHRRDLFTFLNNYPGELDRATAWESRKSATAIKKNWANVAKQEFGMSTGEKQPSEEDFKRMAELAKTELERFKKLMSAPRSERIAATTE